MPVLSSARRDATRSSLRHRPIDTGESAPDPAVLRQRRPPSGAPVTTRLVSPPAGLDENADGEIIVPRRRHVHPLVSIGLGLMLAILLWSGITQALIWVNNQINTFRYGYPRSYQIDAYVGQGDSVQHPSHFVALNMHGLISILEFPGGDPSRVRFIASTQVPGTEADLAVVTLRFLDINEDNRPDMLVAIDGQQSILINDGKTFHPPTATEQQQFIQYMQSHHQPDN